MQVVQVIELDKKRVRVVLDNGREFPLYRGEGKKYSLAEGVELSKEQYEEIHNEILVKRARKRAMHLLERMDRAEAQLRAKLQQGFYPEDIIEDAISYVKGFHYLDDARYAWNYVQNQNGKKSRGRIRLELLGKGICKDTVAQALEEGYGQGQEQELILKWAKKRNYSGKTADLKEKQKIYQFLLRKGFQSDDILHVLDYLT